MPGDAKSIAQQQAAGAALSAKRGETSPADLKGASKEMYKSMSKKELHNLASTKHNHLPAKKEEMLREYIRNYIKECMGSVNDSDYDYGEEESPEGDLYETDKWIQKAVNPAHKGYCSPMSKKTCTPRRKALARRFKKGIEDESLQEKWEHSGELNPAKRGMFKGRSISSLEKELDNLKASGPHKKGSAAYTKEKELDFALRAKHGFGKAEESIDEEDKWIQKAVNPAHKGYCSPMSKKTCTPRRKALARRFKAGIEKEGIREFIQRTIEETLNEALIGKKKI